MDITTPHRVGIVAYPYVRSKQNSPPGTPSPWRILLPCLVGGPKPRYNTLKCSTAMNAGHWGSKTCGRGHDSVARFAEVVVNTTVRHTYRVDVDAEFSPAGLTFHYSIPPHLADVVRPGHLVRVPFRTREVHGIVIALHDESPVPETRPILDLVYPEPVLTSLQLQLARWMAEEYLTPLIYVLKLFLPPRLTAPPEPVIMRVPDVPPPPGLTPEQQLLLARLENGPQPERLLKVGKHNLARPQVLQPLLDRGVVRRVYRVVHRPPQPKTEAYVRLLADEETISHILPQLGRQSKRAEVLAYLLSIPDPLPTVEQVLQAVGCSENTLKRMAQDGCIVYTPPVTRVILLRPVDAFLEEAQRLERRSPRRAHALRTLAHLGSGMDVATARKQGISRSVILQLEREGWLRRVTDPATVHLALSPEEAEERIIELRGTEPHRRVLEALAEEEDPVWIGWLYAETRANRRVIKELEEAGLIAVERAEVWRDPLADRSLPETPEPFPRLIAEQEEVWEVIREALDAPPVPGEPPVFLLHGITGSGKTEIYLRAVAHVLQQGRQVLYLVPEIALTPQTIQRVAARFPGKLVIWHSDLSVGERFDTWRRVMSGDVAIIVGTRSALFAPVSRLGLIVIDEEHDESYKNQRIPYYHARTVALELARRTQSAVILGSATPDVISYTRARRGEYRLLELPQRILSAGRQVDTMKARVGVSLSVRDRWQPYSQERPDVRTIPLPSVRVVDMRLELKAGNRSIFSRALQRALQEVLDAGQQAILFINRRGRASFVLCRDCGHVLKCDRCDVPLTFHITREDPVTHRQEGILLCHHCNRRYPVPDACPVCGSTRIRYFGGGTQRVEAEVRRLFPHARTLRWDRDVTSARGAHWRILEAFANHEADILIGTQMLAKGLDLPRVTLVGVVSADEGLFLPDFRTGERTFQVLTQVAGRAGRGLWGGRVIVQTYNPQHYAIRAAAHHDYARFYAREMAFRKEMRYPPYSRLVRVLYTHTRAERAQQEAERLAGDLRDEALLRGLTDIEIIGPAPCFYARLRGQYRWHIILRGPDPVRLLRAVPLPAGWRADVDPVSLL